MTDGVSRHHARLERREDGAWVIIDTGSTNGIKVNGVKVDKESVIHSDDEIEIGEQCMRIDLDESVVEAADNSVFVSNIDKASADGEKESVVSEVKTLFNGKMPKFFASSQTDGAGAAEGKPPKSKSRFGNILFYVAVAAVVAAVVSVVAKKSMTPESKTQQKPSAVPFVLHYEREIISQDNVFRFSLKLENSVATVTLDDLKNQREIVHQIKDSTGISLLQGKVRDSGIKNLVTEPVRKRDRIYRRITMVEYPNVYQVEMNGEFVPVEIEKIESSIAVFVEDHGLQTISLTPEQLLDMAKESFLKAEDLYSNREANYSNLREAINRYEYAIGYLQQFSPKPPLWAQAGKRLEEAKELRKTKFQDLKFQLSNFERSGNKDQMRRVLHQMMDLVELDSPQYEQAKSLLFRIDSSSRKANKK
jgi:pSer/pThr/pTyr-binding forkhead associated (FHA) protein